MTTTTVRRVFRVAQLVALGICVTAGAAVMLLLLVMTFPPAQLNGTMAEAVLVACLACVFIGTLWRGRKRPPSG